MACTMQRISMDYCNSFSKKELFSSKLVRTKLIPYLFMRGSVCLWQADGLDPVLNCLQFLLLWCSVFGLLYLGVGVHPFLCHRT